MAVRVEKIDEFVGAASSRNPVDGRTRTVPRIDDVIDGIVRHLIRTVESARQVDPGSGWTDPDVDRVLLDLEIDQVRCILIRQQSPSPNDLLSPREQEIARMVQLGYPNKTISSVLDISCWTVASHLRRIFGKLGVNSRAAMAARLAGATAVADVECRTAADGVPDGGHGQGVTHDPARSPLAGSRFFGEE